MLTLLSDLGSTQQFLAGKDTDKALQAFKLTKIIGFLSNGGVIKMLNYPDILFYQLPLILTELLHVAC